MAKDRSDEVLLAIRRLMQTGEIYTKELDKKYGVSATQLNCIQALKGRESVPISRIAEHMMVRSSTLTGVIDRLERKGLVQRGRNSADRRVINVQLTESGRAFAEKAPSSIHKGIVEGLKALPKDEVNRIADALNKLTDMLYADVQEDESARIDQLYRKVPTPTH